MGQTQQALLLTVLLSGSFAWAQAGSAQVHVITPETQVVEAAQAEVAAENAVVSSPAQEVIIVQPQQATASTQVVPVVEQPTTVVTATPLTVSRAEQLRQARERAEIETEQKIVERLEQSRLEDEQRRMKELFGNKLDSQQQQEQEQVQQQPVVVITPTPEPVPQKSEEELKSEIAAQVKADLEAAKKDSEQNKTRWSVGAALATFDYPDAYNTESNFGAGVTLTWYDADRLSMELTALFSEHTVDQSYHLFKKVDQQNWMFAAKYSFLDRKITPVAGALVSYTYREYTDMYGWGYGAFPGFRSASTNAMDVGLVLGLDFMPGKNVSFGLEYRWLTNVDTRYSEPEAFNRAIYNHNGRSFRPLEEIDYELVQMSMKFVF